MMDFLWVIKEKEKKKWNEEEVRFDNDRREILWGNLESTEKKIRNSFENLWKFDVSLYNLGVFTKSVAKTSFQKNKI